MDPSEEYAKDLIQKGVLTREQLADIRAAFIFFDKNGDGTVSYEELETALKYLGHEISDSQLHQMIAQVDQNGDGSLDYGEFLRAMMEYYTHQPTSERTNDMSLYRRAFAEFDHNGDGFIDADELKGTMSSLGETLTNEDIQDMMKEADRDGDGKVGFQDIKQSPNPV
ncbi:unnamed protein product [Calicophoron daubneyi]|uniref:EF-hand domain-containing protein n=1 Tax=Calicophoron daubneyi TaxID=300641 RepID=A0AAV2T2S6_CALDB